MAELERMLRIRYGDATPKTPTTASPRTPPSPTIEQLLRAGEASRWSPTTSPTFGKDHEMEEDHAHHHKKSVIAKVKERAKKWRNTLAKKKHSQEGNTTPSWGVSLDEDEEEENPEYLGAPIYESELAPEEYKETARQHPRAFPVIPEKHILASSVKQGDEQEREKEKPPSTSSVKHAVEQDKAKPLNKSTITETVTEKLAPAYATVSEKLAPAYATVSDTAHAIGSKIQGLTISVLAAPATGEHASAGGGREHASAGGGREHASNTGEQIWDKGVSVKEYLMHKLEPGEDERALSQVISEAISPKKTPGNVGVVEKVREAVASLLRNDESSTSKIVHSATNSSSHIPVSTNSHEVVEEENHGRILQAN